MRARITRVFLFAWLAIAVAPAVSCAHPDPGPGAAMAVSNCHQVRKTETADGVTFRAKDGVVLERASVPDAVLYRAGSTLCCVNGEAAAHWI